MRIRSVALIGVMSLAGLGLVGAGAHAIYTANTTSTETVTATPIDYRLDSECQRNYVSVSRRLG